MSAFSPMALGGNQNQKQQLLRHLMDQFQQAASRAAGLAGQGASTTPGAGYHPPHPFGGSGLVVNPVRQLPSGLRNALGPGAIGTPAGAESSTRVGNPVSPLLYANPHAGGPTIPTAPAVQPSSTPPPSPPSLPNLPITPQMRQTISLLPFFTPSYGVAGQPAGVGGAMRGYAGGPVGPPISIFRGSFV